MIGGDRTALGAALVALIACAGTGVPDAEIPAAPIAIGYFDPKTGARTPGPGARPGAVPQAWSPDRRRLLFSQIVRGQPQLFEVDIAGADVRRVTRGPAAHPQGCYGPEGRLVLMSVDVTSHRAPSRILLTGPGGTRPRPISEGPYDIQPACAPDVGS